MFAGGVCCPRAFASSIIATAAIVVTVVNNFFMNVLSHWPGVSANPWIMRGGASTVRQLYAGELARFHDRCIRFVRVVRRFPWIIHECKVSS